MTSAMQKRKRWDGDLPADLWAKHAESLAYDLRPEIFNNVALAYQLIESWNTEKSEDIDWAEVNEDLHEVRMVRESLRDGLSRLHTKRPSRAISRQLGILSVVAAVLLILIGLWASFVPRPDRSEEAIGHAIGRQFGRSAIVDCDAKGRDWSCEVSSASRLECYRGPQASAMAQSTTQVVAAALSQSQSCRGNATASTTYDVTEDGDQLISTAHQTRAQLERKLTREAMTTQQPKDNYFLRALKWITGEQ